MVQVKAKGDEPVEILLRRFNREIQKAGIPKELRKREFYEKPALLRKRKKAQKKRRGKIAKEKKRY